MPNRWYKKCLWNWDVKPKNVQTIIQEKSGVFRMLKPLESNTEELEGLRPNFEVQQFELDATLEAVKQDKDRVSYLEEQLDLSP